MNSYYSLAQGEILHEKLEEQDYEDSLQLVMGKYVTMETNGKFCINIILIVLSVAMENTIIDKF